MKYNFLKILAIILSIGFNCGLNAMEKDENSNSIKEYSILDLIADDAVSFLDGLDAHDLSHRYYTDGDGKMLYLRETGLTNLCGLSDTAIRKHEIICLYLANNNLTGNIKQMILLKNLRKVFLNSNQLKELPETICSLIHLKHLDLNDNQLKELPEGMCSLIHLKHLDLNDNQFKKFPEIICSLIHLEYLHLSSNKLRKLSKTIGSLTQLQGLHLYDNQLQELPKKMDLLITHLKILDLGRNELKPCQLIPLYEKWNKNDSSIHDKLFIYPQSTLLCEAAKRVIENIEEDCKKGNRKEIQKMFALPSELIAYVKFLVHAHGIPELNFLIAFGFNSSRLAS